jgi:hypothetical protein
LTILKSRLSLSREPQENKMENLKQCEKKRGKNLRGKKVQGKPVPKGGAKKVKTGHTFQPGNKLWQLREFPGRPPTFETPEQF